MRIYAVADIHGKKESLETICSVTTRLLLKNLLPLNKETILVAHPPPRGVCDRVANRFNAGSQNLFDFINTTQPKMLLCGHIHEQAGQGFIKDTLVINCAVNTIRAGAIIDLEKGHPPRVNFLQAKQGNAMEAH